MADPELVRVLDYILNRCDAAAIDAVSAAVVRRKRDIALFDSAGLSDPRRWARDVARDASVGSSLESVRATVRSMVSEMVRKEAPELSDEQLEELLSAWIPNAPDSNESDSTHSAAVAQPDMVLSMIEQFVAYSTGEMPPEEEKKLRAELGAWPERYWRSFPAVVRSIVTEYLEGHCNASEFRLKLRSALDLKFGKGT